ncbi:signal protein PDZ [Clostridium butyricum]|uniref:signal protein PDZ n=1 Tax=Clostridium butyricum TaxID=1492 RepID=UPI00374EAEE4
MDIVISTLRSICSAILFPPSVFILLALLVIFYFKNKKRAAMQKMIVGGSVESAIELTLSQFVFGVFGGIIGSVILNLCGVVFNENCRIEILFFTSIILMAIKPSLVCFSYSASVLGAISIILKIYGMISSDVNYTNYFNLDILYIMIFVGVMHVVEGILVSLDGHRGAVPILIKKENEILGGYSLKRYWILPLAIMIMANMNDLYGGFNNVSLNDIPAYWTLFKSQDQIDLLRSIFISLLSFYAVVGYSSVTYTRTKREKAVSSGIHISIYGVLLILVAQAARIGLLGEIFVVIFAPVAHEFMLKIQRNKEMKRQPKFISDENGLVILEIGNNFKLKDFNMDINSKIISVNNESLNSERDIYSILKKNLSRAVIKFEDCNGVIKEVNYVHDNSRIGALFVPFNKSESQKTDDSEIREKSFKDILNNVNRNNN